MGFVPTVLFDSETIGKVERGELKLQCGQWVRFHNSDNFSCRFIGVSKAGVVWVTHSEQYKPLSMSKFRQTVSNFKRLHA